MQAQVPWWVAQAVQSLLHGVKMLFANNLMRLCVCDSRILPLTLNFLCRC